MPPWPGGPDLMSALLGILVARKHFPWSQILGIGPVAAAASLGA